MASAITKTARRSGFKFGKFASRRANTCGYLNQARSSGLPPLHRALYRTGDQVRSAARLQANRETRADLPSRS